MRMFYKLKFYAIVLKTIEIYKWSADEYFIKNEIYLTKYYAPCHMNFLTVNKLQISL